MSLHDITQVALERAMSGSALRQQALAANIANVNTPGYQRHDVEFHDTLAKAMSAGRPQDASFSVDTDESVVARADGNGVDIDVEQANLAQNGLEYQSLVTVAKTRIDILRAAMGAGS